MSLYGPAKDLQTSEHTHLFLFGCMTQNNEYNYIVVYGHSVSFSLTSCWALASSYCTWSQIAWAVHRSGGPWRRMGTVLGTQQWQVACCDRERSPTPPDSAHLSGPPVDDSHHCQICSYVTKMKRWRLYNYTIEHSRKVVIFNKITANFTCIIRMCQLA